MTDRDRMERVPQVGDRCQTIIPVSPDCVDLTGIDVKQIAADALQRLCEQHGLNATDHRMTWHGTITDARLMNLDGIDGLPDDTLLYCFAATAA